MKVNVNNVKPQRGDRREHKKVFPKPKVPEQDVSLLTYGPHTNFFKFNEKLSRSCLKEFGDLGRLVELEEYYEPEHIHEGNYDFTNDPHGLIMFDYKNKIKARNALVQEMDRNRTKMYGFMQSKFSPESLEEVLMMQGTRTSRLKS